MSLLSPPKRTLLRATFGWLILGLVWPSSASAVDPREQYRLGLELYDERNYESALERFEESFRNLPSPNSQLYVARCLRSMGRTAAAIVAYERAVQLARERARTEPKYELTFQNALRELAVLRPPPLPRQRYVPATWTAASVGVAGFASFAVFGAMAHARYTSLQSNCNPLPCDATQAGHVQSGRLAQTLANVSLAIGTTGAAAAVTLFILGRPQFSAYGQVGVTLDGVRFSGEF